LAILITYCFELPLALGKSVHLELYLANFSMFGFSLLLLTWPYPF
jgi:hypothetical protein